MLAEKLKKGDTIGIISPSHILSEKEDLEMVEKAIEMMEREGFKVKKGRYAFVDETGYGTTAQHKAEDLINMFADKDVKAIFSITGGNNCLSTFEYIDWEIIKQNLKIFCGFSDTTSLVNEINEQTGLVTFLGPSFKSIASGETDYRLKAVIDRFVKGEDNLFYDEDFEEVKVIREGKATGKLAGGNLSLTTDLVSGNYKIDFKNKILLLEDLFWESPAEKVSHDLYRLKQNGVFEEISGIWVGNYEGEIPLEKILLDTIQDIEFNKPIIKSENFGHAEKKIAVPIGAEAQIDSNQNIKIQIREKLLK